MREKTHTVTWTEWKDGRRYDHETVEKYTID